MHTYVCLLTLLGSVACLQIRPRQYSVARILMHTPRAIVQFNMVRWVQCSADLIRVQGQGNG